jgi:small subunit ribosomal protein S3
MGQKVNPIALRVGRTLPWSSRWFSDNQFAQNLLEDIKIRTYLNEKVKLAGVASIEIERLPKSITVVLTVSRPGVVIGRGGSGIEDVKKGVVSLLTTLRGKAPTGIKIDLKVHEVKNAELSAVLVAQRIASELERRLPSRRVATRTMERVMQSGAAGVKIVLSGRIQGADIARREKFHLGSVPTQTIREHVDYAQVPANGIRGYVGVKVWIYQKEK